MCVPFISRSDALMSAAGNILALMTRHRIWEDDLRDLANSLETFFTFLGDRLPSNHDTPAGATRSRLGLLPLKPMYREWVERYGRSISHAVLRQVFHFYCENTITNALEPDYDYQISTTPCLIIIYKLP